VKNAVTAAMLKKKKAKMSHPTSAAVNPTKTPERTKPMEKIVGTTLGPVADAVGA